MTLEKFKTLTVGALVKIKDDAGKWEVGEILKIGQEVTIIWPETDIINNIGLTKSWESFINELEVEE